MKLTDRELKQRYQEFVAADPDLERRNCPSTEELRKAVLKVMRRRRKLRTMDHVFSCGACAREYETLTLLYQEEKKMAQSDLEQLALSRQDIEKLRREKVELAPESLSVWERARVAVSDLGVGFLGTKINYRYAALAASLFIAIVGIYLVRPWMNLPREGAYRGAGEDKIVLQAPAGVLRSAPDMFQWAEASHVDYYQIYLLDEELNRLWVSEKVAVNFLSLPQEAIERLKAGRTYFWKVRIYTQGGSVEESELRDFKIAQ